MNIFVYSDESGVLDSAHNDYYVFGGLVFLSKEEKDNASRKYLAIENLIREIEHKDKNFEIKATTILNKSKSKLFRSVNNYEKFGVVVKQKQLREQIFLNKKHKQRYLDYVYKLSIKRKFEQMIRQKQINPYDVEGIYFYIDEHTTATDGIYELRESLLTEFKDGMFTANFMSFKEPIFPNLKHLEVKYCNSSKNTLVRAADIIANKIYFCATHDKLLELKNEKFNIITQP